MSTLDMLIENLIVVGQLNPNEHPRDTQQFFEEIVLEDPEFEELRELYWVIREWYADTEEDM